MDNIVRIDDTLINVTRLIAVTPKTSHHNLMPEGSYLKLAEAQLFSLDVDNQSLRTGGVSEELQSHKLLTLSHLYIPHTRIGVVGRR